MTGVTFYTILPLYTQQQQQHKVPKTNTILKISTIIIVKIKGWDKIITATRIIAAINV